MDEVVLLKRKLMDAANKSYNSGIYTYTNFLNINELSIKCSWAAGGAVSNAENTVIWGYEL